MLRRNCYPLWRLIAALLIALSGVTGRAQPAPDAAAPATVAKNLAGSLTARLVWATELPPFQGRGNIHNPTYSPDGRFLLTHSEDGREGKAFSLWDAATGKLLVQLEPAAGNERGGTTSVAYSSDGKWILGNWGLGFSTLWETATGRARFTTRLHSGTILHTTFLPDGKHFATGGTDGKLCVTRIEDQAVVASWTIKPENAAAGRGDPFGKGGGGVEMVNGLDVAKDGKRIVTTHWKSNSSEAILWQIGSEAPLLRLERPNDGSGRVFDATRFSPDGTQLVSAGAKNVPRASTRLKSGPDQVNALVLRQWDAKTGQPVAEIAPDDVFGSGMLQFSPDDRTFATDDWGAIHLWRLGDKRPFREIERPGFGSIGGITFSPDGKHLTSRVENSLKTWDVATSELVSSDVVAVAPVSAVAWSNSGPNIAVGRGNKIEVLDVAARRQLKLLSAGEPMWLTGHGAKIFDLVFPQGDAALIAVAEREEPPARVVNVLRIWNVATGEMRGEIATKWNFQRDAPRFAIAADGRRALVQTLGLALYDLPSRKELAALPDVRAKAFRFMPDGRFVWVVDFDGQVVRWDPEKNTQDGKYSTEWRPENERGAPNDASFVQSAAFSPDGQILVTSHDRTNRATPRGALVFWDNELGLVRRVLRDQPAYELTVSPDGHLLAGFESRAIRGQANDIIHIWEMVTGQELLQLDPNNASAMAIAFSPDSKQLLIGFDRGTFEIWEFK